MTSLRFQTGARHETSSAPLRGLENQKFRQKGEEEKRHLNHYGTILYRPERTYPIFTCVFPSSVRVGPVGPVTRSECCACLKNNPPLNYTNAKMGQHGRDRNSVLRLECRDPVLL